MLSSRATKVLGAVLAAIGAPLLHVAVPGASWMHTSAALAAGLMLIFFSREAVDDERVRDLKLKAMSAAFSASFALTLIVNWFLNRDFDPRRDFDGTTGVLRSISAFDLMIVIMIAAIGLFHYWRILDAEAVPSEPG
jgi:hypothetical protein